MKQVLIPKPLYDRLEVADKSYPEIIYLFCENLGVRSTSFCLKPNFEHPQLKPQLLLDYERISKGTPSKSLGFGSLKAIQPAGFDRSSAIELERLIALLAIYFDTSKKAIASSAIAWYVRGKPTLKWQEMRSPYRPSIFIEMSLESKQRIQDNKLNVMAVLRDFCEKLAGCSLEEIEVGIHYNIESRNLPRGCVLVRKRIKERSSLVIPYDRLLENAIKLLCLEHDVKKKEFIESAFRSLELERWVSFK